MNKKIVIGAAVVVAIILVVVFLSKRSSAPGVTETGKAGKDVPATQESKTDSVLGSLKDAVGLGKKMTCVSKDASGDTTTYIDGKKYKGVTTTPAGKQIAIFTGEDFYGWNDKTKEGFKMTKACTEELAKDLPKNDSKETQEDNFVTTEDIVADEEFNKNCTETIVPVDFSIPADVKFVDQCELMKNITKNLPTNLQDIPNLKDLQIPGQ